MSTQSTTKQYQCYPLLHDNIGVLSTTVITLLSTIPISNRVNVVRTIRWVPNYVNMIRVKVVQAEKISISGQFVTPSLLQSYGQWVSRCRFKIGLKERSCSSCSVSQVIILPPSPLISNPWCGRRPVYQGFNVRSVLLQRVLLLLKFFQQPAKCKTGQQVQSWNMENETKT